MCSDSIRDSLVISHAPRYELVEPSKVTKEMLAAGAAAALILAVCVYYMYA